MIRGMMSVAALALALNVAGPALAKKAAAKKPAARKDKGKK